jgi:hypothetical protein
MKSCVVRLARSPQKTMALAAAATLLVAALAGCAPRDRVGRGPVSGVTTQQQQQPQPAASSGSADSDLGAVDGLIGDADSDLTAVDQTPEDAD